MPSVFEQLMAAGALDALYEQLGVPATYTGPDGATAAVTVRRQPQTFSQSPGGAGGQVDGELQTADVLVRQADTGWGAGGNGGARAPVKNGRFAVDTAASQDAGGVWTIQTNPMLKNGQYTCTCQRGGPDRLAARRERR